MNLKAVGAAMLAVVLSFGIGWVSGASGRNAAQAEQSRLQVEHTFTRARAAMLDGRVSLFLVNFGDASKRFEEARALVESLQTRLRSSGDSARAGKLDAVLVSLEEAKRRASSVDQGAQSAADAALQALTSVEKGS